jgi:glycerophosphoryl diester phosphodiesterase
VTFVDALARGATGLETDAWITADGAVVLDHDGLAGPPGRQPIAEVRRDQLPAHIATLDELYEQCGTDFALAVDVKTPAVTAALVATAARHDAAHNLWVVAPAAAQLADIRDAHRVVTIRGNVLRSRRRPRALAAAAELDVAAINARWMWWNRGLVEQVHRMGMLVFGYDAQRTISLDRSFRIGVDGVFSDHVDRLVTALAKAM